MSFFLLPLTASPAQQSFESDTFAVGQKKLVIHFIGHGTLMLDYDGLIIHVDPVGRYADYTKLPKADIILVTHQHQDHLDKKAIALIKKENTVSSQTKPRRRCWASAKQWPTAIPSP